MVEGYRTCLACDDGKEYVYDHKKEKMVEINCRICGGSKKIPIGYDKK